MPDDDLRELFTSINELVQVTKRMSQDITALQSQQGRGPYREPQYPPEARRVIEWAENFHRPPPESQKQHSSERWEALAKSMMRTILAEPC